MENLEDEIKELKIKLSFSMSMIEKYVLPLAIKKLEKFFLDTKDSYKEIKLMKEHYNTRILRLITKKGSDYIVKIYDDTKDEFYKERYYNQIKASEILKDFNEIPKIIFCDGNMIIMEYIEGITLEQYIKDGGKIEETNTKEYLVNFLRRLSHLTSNKGVLIDNEMTDDKINNRDIKEVIKSYDWLVDLDDSNFIFSHCDLHDENIIIRNKKVVAIIDWEISGFYPGNYERLKYEYLKDNYRYINEIYQSINGVNNLQRKF